MAYIPVAKRSGSAPSVPTGGYVPVAMRSGPIAPPVQPAGPFRYGDTFSSGGNEFEVRPPSLNDAAGLPTPGAKLSLSPLPKIGSAQSTPTTTDKPDIFQKTAAFADPRTPVPVRPLFGKKEENIPIGGLGKLLYDVPARTIEGAMRAIPQFISNVKKEPVQTPFSPKRLGVEEFKPTMERYVERRAALDVERKAKPFSSLSLVNGIQAGAETFLSDILDVAVLSGVVESTAKNFLRKTAFSPTLGIKSRSLEGLTPEESKRVVAQRAVGEIHSIGNDLSAGKITDKAAAEKLMAIKTELSKLHSVIDDATVPKLNSFGKLLEDTAVALTEDVTKVGRRNYIPVAERPGQKFLPGTAPRAGQAPAFGMSTQEVGPVGYGDGKIAPQTVEKSRFATGEDLVRYVAKNGAGYGAPLNTVEMKQLIEHLISLGDESKTLKLYGKNMERGTVYRSYGGGTDVVLGKVPDPRFGDTMIVAQINKNGKLDGRFRMHATPIEDKNIITKLGDQGLFQLGSGKTTSESSSITPIEPVVSSPKETMNTDILPKEVSVVEESKRVGAKRISPDRVPHQQVTPQQGIQKIVESEVARGERNAKSWENLAEKAQKLIDTYGGKLPIRSEGNIQKYPGLLEDFRTFSLLKENAHGFSTLESMRDQFVRRADMNRWSPEKIKAFTEKGAIESYKKLIKEDISKGYKYPDAVLNYDKSFRVAVDNRARYEKGLRTSFSADDSRIVFDDVDKIGAGMKRQDGKAITDTQKNEIKQGVVDFSNTLGLDMKKLAENNRWVYVHLNGKNPFLMKNLAGLYREGKDSISISVGGVESFDKIVDGKKVRETVHTTMAHELGHAIDYKTKNKLFDTSFIWKRTRDYNPIKYSSFGSKYWGSRNEVTARMIEEYVAIAKGQEGLYTRQGYWNKDIFEKEIKPAVEGAIEKHFSDYKLTPKKSEPAKETATTPFKSAEDFIKNTAPALPKKPIVAPTTPEEAQTRYYNDVISPALKEGKPIQISADDMKDHFGGDYNDANHPIYSRAAFKTYEDALPEVKNPTVVLTGGGPGSGKTELIAKDLARRGFDGIIYDSNMANYDGVVKQIELAKSAGKKVEIYGVLPNLEKSRGFTILRENEKGRGISDKTFARGHAGFPAVAKRLLEEGKIAPEDVHLYDMRNEPTLQDALKKIAEGEHEKDPLATLRNVQYNEETLLTQHSKQNYDLTTGRRIQEQGTREGRGSSLDQNRADSASLGRGDRSGAGQTIRSEEVGRSSSELNLPPPQKKLFEVLKKKPNVSVPKTSEDILDSMKLERDRMIEARDNHPARELVKYIDPRTGMLPEVTGTPLYEQTTLRELSAAKKLQNKFAVKGDDIVTEYGYSDSEQAREAVGKYQHLTERIKILNSDIREKSHEIIDKLATEKDVKALQKFLNASATKSDKEYAESIVKKPEAEAALTARKKLAEIHISEIIGATYKTIPDMSKETLQTQTTIHKGGYDLTLEEWEKGGEGDPFSKIVVDTSTPIKEKVGMLDYLRTPDRVLKKLKLDPVAKELRNAYDNYLAELPLHIDLITAWSERVPKEANEPIFRFLDGQTTKDHFSGKVHTKLSPQEMKVAIEIRDYLREWADRLGLPEDQKISHYITHIFGIGENEKEFPEEIANLIKDKVPGSVYDPFLEKRLGAKGYEQDTWKALDAYVKRAVRKANMDPALAMLKDASLSMEDSQRTYLKRLGDRVNLRPTEVDTLLDNTIKQLIGYKFGQRPVAFVSRHVRQAVYRAFLGLNVGSAIKNLTQGVNTYSKLGEKYTAIGYTKLITQWSGDELYEVGVLKQDMIQDRTISATGKGIEKMDKVLFTLFDLAEKINRGAAYFGAKAKALDAGASEMQAVEYAKKIIRDTQFHFGSIDTPVGMNSDITKIFTQFLTFGVKQTEFLTEMAKKKEWAGLLRYIAASIGIVWALGEEFNIKATDFIPVTALSRFGTPPSMALPGSIFGAVVNAPDFYGNPRTLEKKITDVLKNIPFPATMQIQKTYGGLDTYNDPKKKTVQSTPNLIKATFLGKQNLEKKAKQDSRSALPKLPKLPKLSLPKLLKI